MEEWGGGVPPCEAGAQHICVMQHPITEISITQQSVANQNFENLNFNQKKVKQKVLV